MIELLLYLPFLLPVVAANLSERQRRSPYRSGDDRTDAVIDALLRYAPYALLALLNLGLLGIAFLALAGEFAQTFAPGLLGPADTGIEWLGVAATCFLAALLASLVLLPAVRRWLARRLPIDAASMVHTTALAFAAYQTGLSLAQMALIGDLEMLTAEGLSLTILDLVWASLPLLLFGLLGVGYLIRRPGRETLDRLGLRRPTWKQLAAAAGVTVLLLALDFAVNLAWQALDPAGYGLLERVTESIFGGLATVGGAVALGLTAGIGEEVLFRGAVQPRLGLLLTSFLFAIGHLQYGLTVATLEILVIGLVLGVMRNRTSTTICIVIHATYNTVGTLLGML
jgi:membrane protease YdiL (CAAX protease family)